MAHTPAASSFRERLKGGLDLIATALVAPSIVAYRLTSPFGDARRTSVFQGLSQMLSLFPGVTGSYLRRAFYRATLARCSSNCFIGFGTIFSSPGAEVGEHVYVGANCTIGFARIDDDVLIGSNVDILSGRNQHRFDRLDVPIRLQGGAFELVTIGRDAWVGNSACILADVGEQAIVAAGAVVVKPVASRDIVGGNPARQIGHRQHRSDLASSNVDSEIG